MWRAGHACSPTTKQQSDTLATFVVVFFCDNHGGNIQTPDHLQNDHVEGKDWSQQDDRLKVKKGLAFIFQTMESIERIPNHPVWARVLVMIGEGCVGLNQKSSSRADVVDGSLRRTPNHNKFRLPRKKTLSSLP